MLRKIAGVCGITSQLVGLTVFLVAISNSPWFSWRGNYVSVLGVKGSTTMLFNSGLILTGVLSLIFAFGLRKSLLSSRWEKWGIVSLVLGSFAFSAIGIFPRTVGLAHDLASTLFYVIVYVGIFIIGVIAIITSQKILGALSLSMVLVMTAVRLFPWPWSGGAIPELLACSPWSLWTVVIGVRLLMRPNPVDI